MKTFQISINVVSAVIMEVLVFSQMLNQIRSCMLYVFHFIFLHQLMAIGEAHDLVVMLHGSKGCAVVNCGDWSPFDCVSSIVEQSYLFRVTLPGSVCNDYYIR